MLVSLLAGVVCGPAAQDHVPPASGWEHRTAAESGFSDQELEEAVAFAVASENQIPIDLDAFIAQSFSREMHNEIVGPTRDRARQNGMIIQGGFVVAEWGDTERPDMTFSVTKTYLSTVVGLAQVHGRIGDVHEPVAKRVFLPEFEGERHGRITWDHLLRQTSDWRGDLWGKPSWADRPPRGNPTEAEQRAVPEREPGTSWEYNDVCVNLLAYAALEAWREPLPKVLDRLVMTPIGASSTWRWHGYSTSWGPLDGQYVQSVSGGGHHGGGMFVSTRDQARFGLLCLREGLWGDKQIIPKAWIDYARQPTAVRPDYGVMNWFLNAEGVDEDGKATRTWPAAPAGAVCFRGAGSNLVYLDFDADLLVVLRWFDGAKLNELLAQVYAARVSTPVGGR